MCFALVLYNTSLKHALTICLITGGNVTMVDHISFNSWVNVCLRVLKSSSLTRIRSLTTTAITTCPAKSNSETMTESTSSCDFPRTGRREGRLILPLSRFVSDCVANQLLKTHTKKPMTLPTPSMRAAQAFPAGWAAEGSVSTKRARSTAWTKYRCMRQFTA